MKHYGRTRRSDPGIAIIGPGRLGQALGRLLAGQGFRIRCVAARRVELARRAVRFIGSGKPLALSAAGKELVQAGVVLLTVADAALPELARDLASGPRGRGHDGSQAQARSWRGKVVLHTCGSLPASVLLPLKRQGAAVGSLHPFQTIPNPVVGLRNLRGCFWGIEGDRKALRIAKSWIEALDGVSFRVNPSRKISYHLAAFLACPTVVTLMDESMRLLRRSGVPEKIARPMLGRFVTSTAHNFVELGARPALTGPAVRRDWPTIRRHLATLRGLSPETVPIYRALLQGMLRLAGVPFPAGRGSR